MKALPLPPIGKEFNLLKVTGYTQNKHGSGQRTKVICDCQCGTTGYEVFAKKLRSGDAVSCGCNRHRQNDQSRSPEYRAWTAMIRRCTDKRVRGYKRYGGRGIKVCERWMVFANFLADVGLRPSEKHSIGRERNDGDYEPGNVRWETKLQQANNCSDNRLLTLDGRTQTMAQWSREYGVPYGRLQMRLETGFTLLEALTLKKGERRKRLVKR